MALGSAGNAKPLSAEIAGSGDSAWPFRVQRPFVMIVSGFRGNLLFSMPLWWEEADYLELELERQRFGCSLGLRPGEGAR